MPLVEPEFFTVTYANLENYYKTHIKGIFSGVDFVKILQSTPKEVQGIRFCSSEIVTKKVNKETKYETVYIDINTVDTNLICQGLKQLHKNINYLDFNTSQLMISKNGEELLRIVESFPSGVRRLFLGQFGNQTAQEISSILKAIPNLRSLHLWGSSLLRFSTQELVDIFSCLPKKLRILTIDGLNFSNRSSADLTRVFESLPRGLTSLNLNNLSFNKNTQDNNAQLSPFHALPRTLNHLYLSYNNLGLLPTESIIKMLNDLPNTLTTLTINLAKLQNKNHSELKAIYSAIPKNITELSLTSNDIEKRHTNELSELNSILEGHMKRGSSSDFKYAEYSSNQPTLVQEQARPKPNIFPSLTADEKQHEFGYLIALERTQRALWFKNPTAFKEDVENYNSNMIKQGILPQNEPSKLVNYYMAYVIKRIASVNNLNESIRHMFTKNSLDYQIDADKPQTFNTSSNRAELIFLWTSLILLGSLITEKKINHESIKVGHTVDTSNELGLFSLFSAKSFYNTTFKALLDKDMINNYLLLSSTSILEDEYIDEVTDVSTTALPEEIETIADNSFIDDLRCNASGPIISAEQLCRLAKAGNLAEIKKYTITKQIINQRVSYAIIGSFSTIALAYDALMVATAYRHLNVVKYFIEEKQADCDSFCGPLASIDLIECAKMNWWFIPKSSNEFIQYIEDCYWKYHQRRFALQFIDYANRTHDIHPNPEQLQELVPPSLFSESFCVKVADIFEQTSSTEEILSLLSMAVACKDKAAAIDLGQRYQINSESRDLNASFDAYLEAVKLGEEEALVPLERLAQRVSAEKKLELSTVYQSLFHNEDKATYWRSKSMEQSNSSLTL